MRAKGESNNAHAREASAQSAPHATTDERVEFEPQVEPQQTPAQRPSQPPPWSAAVDEPSRDKIIRQNRDLFGDDVARDIADSEIGQWRRHRGIDNEGPFPGGDRAPETPQTGPMAAPGTPVSMPGPDDGAEDSWDLAGPGGAAEGHDVDMDVALPEVQQQADDDDDVQPLLQLCAPEPDLCQEIRRTARDILALVRDLGGDSAKYKRERKKAVQEMVSEVYSAPRVTATLRTMPWLGLIPGFALDLTTRDTDGRLSDLEQEDMRTRALKRVDEEKPMFVISSPSCTPYSSFQSINNQRRDPLVVQRERAVQ